MKVLLVNTLYLPNIGGVENYIRSIALSLIRQGASVEIVASDRSGSQGDRLRSIECIDGVRVSRFRYAPRGLGFPGQLWLNASLIRQRVKAVSGFDYVIARSHDAVLACRLAGVRRVTYIVPGLYSAQYAHRSVGSGPRSSLAYVGNVALQYIALRSSSEVIVLSEGMRAQIDGFCRRMPALRRVPPGVDTNRFVPVSEREKSSRRWELGLPTRSRLILGVGRYTQIKGFVFAIESLRYLPKDYELVLVGRGPQEAEYRRIAEHAGVVGRVHFAGATTSPEKYYQACDAFVLPSLYEPYGQVLLEATASGLPIIAFTRHAGVETATEEVYGQWARLVELCDNRSSRGLARSIQNAMSVLEEDRSPFDRERGDFLSRYSWDRVAKDILGNESGTSGENF